MNKTKTQKQLDLEEIKQEYKLYKIINPKSKQTFQQFTIDCLRKILGHPTRAPEAFKFIRNLVQYDDNEEYLEIFLETTIIFYMDFLKAFDELKQRDKEFVILKTLGFTNKEIGKMYKISGDRVNQIINNLKSNFINGGKNG